MYSHMHEHLYESRMARAAVEGRLGLRTWGGYLIHTVSGGEYGWIAMGLASTSNARYACVSLETSGSSTWHTSQSLFFLVADSAHINAAITGADHLTEDGAEPVFISGDPPDGGDINSAATVVCNFGGSTVRPKNPGLWHPTSNIVSDVTREPHIFPNPALAPSTYDASGMAFVPKGYYGVWVNDTADEGFNNDGFAITEVF